MEFERLKCFSVGVIVSDEGRPPCELEKLGDEGNEDLQELIVAENLFIENVSNLNVACLQPLLLSVTPTGNLTLANCSFGRAEFAELVTNCAQVRQLLCAIDEGMLFDCYNFPH